MQTSDPFRQNAPSASDEDLTALVEQGPVSRGLGLGAVFDEAQITDRVLGFIQSDDRRAFDAQLARQFGDQYGNMLTPEAAKEEFDIDVDGPVNRHRAAEMLEQQQLRRYREDLAGRAQLSALDTIGASLLGGATDPVLLPTWFIGGGASAVRALGVAGRGTRGANLARGAAVGVIDGITGGVAAEAINAGARLSTGEDYSGGDALRNILFGATLGGAVGGAVGAAQRPVSRDVLRSAMRAQETGSNPRQISRDPDGAGPAGGGAVGALQLLPETAERMAQRLGIPFSRERLLNDVAYNVRLSDEYMSILTQRYGGDQFLAVTAYHAGEGNVDAWIRRHGDPRTGAISRADWLDRVGRNNPRSAHYPRAVFERMGLDIDGGARGDTLESLTAPAAPAAVRGLTENERIGGFVEAMEAVAEDGRVDLGSLLARNGLDALDETTAVPSIRGRWLEADTAVARSGAEIPVRFAVVELADLKTSHADDLTPLADYPTALQPRDRQRAGAQAENYNLERDLNPALLMRDRAASGGAPIVSPDGLVESGNGRTIALRRSAATGTEAWGRYQAELARSGVDTSGFDRPVLVRMRSEPMTGQGRADLARDLNQSPVEAYSPVEQARADARRLDADTLGLLDGDDPFSAGNRPFLRGFIARAAANDANALTDARGAISAAGKARVQAALVQRAYGDDLLTAALFETADPNIRLIGQALADAAPAWARMRAEAPKAMDLTGNLTGAVALIREARAQKIGVAELLDERLGQADLLSGEALSPETGAMVRLMFRDEALTKPRGVERIGEALKDYARAAAATPDGPDLFGETPNGQATLDTLLARYAGAEGEGRNGLAYAGGSEPLWTTREAGPAGLDLRPAVEDGGGPGGDGGGRGDGGGADGAGGAGGGEPAARLTGEELAPLDAPTPVLRQAARDFYAGTLNGTSVESQALGRPVRFGAAGKGKALSLSADPAKLRLFPALPEMVAQGRLVVSAPSHKARQSSGTVFHQLETAVELSGEIRTVRVWVREDGNGDFYYDHRVQADPAGPGTGSTPASKAGAVDPAAGEATKGNIGEAGAKSEAGLTARRGANPIAFEASGSARASEDATMAARYAAMSRDEKLGWHADSEIQYARSAIARLETEGPTAFLPADRVAQTIEEYRARIAQLEALGADGRLGDDPGIRALADARPLGAAGTPTSLEAKAKERADAFIAADPELKALVEDTEALARAAGLDLPPFDASTEPSTLAEAIRAAAFCLTTEFVA